MKNNIKQLMGRLKITLLLMTVSLTGWAQWTTNGNNIYNSNTGKTGIGTTAPASKFQAIGESRFGDAANYFKVNSTGTLSIAGSGNYQVGANKYMFKHSNAGNRGLYINGTDSRFELRDSTSGDLFHVNYFNADAYYKGKLSVGTAASSNTMDIKGGAVIGAGYSGTKTAPTNGLLVQSQVGVGTSSLPAESRFSVGGINNTSYGGRIQFNSPVSGTYTKAYFIETYFYYHQILDGTNAGPQHIRMYLNQNGNSIGINTSSIPTTDPLVVYSGSSTGRYTQSGWTHSSDERLKTNIKPLENALDKIVKLQGVSFNWKKCPNSDNQIGFIAQEVEKVFPEVIVKDADGNYAMVIQNLVAPVVEALKLQQKQIEEKDKAIKILKSEIDQLLNENATLSSGVDNLENGISQCCLNANTRSGSLTSVIEDLAKLEQNSPNPFHEKTIVRCYIPQRASNAVIKIYSIKGEEMKSIPVNAKGLNQLEIAGSALSAGTYNYLLIVDGKTIDRKLMIITK